jgi:putative GTP pyrophosphokinase
MIISIPVFLSDRTVDTKVEIQIRTIAMDFWASLEHKIYYKFEGNAPEHIRKELRECSEIVAYLDQKMLSLNEEIKCFSRDRIQEYHSEITGTYRSVVAESFGAIVEEEEEEEIKPLESSADKKTDSAKTGKKRMLFGLRA